MKKAVQPVSYQPAPMETRKDVPRSYSYTQMDVILCTQEAQIAYERIERGGLRVVNDVMIQSDDDDSATLSHFGGTCYLLEDRWPDVYMRWFRSMERAEVLHEVVDTTLTRTETYLELESVRINKLLEDAYIRGEPPKVRHKRAYLSTCASHSHQRVINMVLHLDAILLKMDQLKFNGVFKPLQRKEAGQHLMKNVLRSATRLIELENRISAEMRDRREERRKVKAKQEEERKAKLAAGAANEETDKVEDTEGDDATSNDIDALMAEKKGMESGVVEQVEKELDPEV